MPLPPSAHHEEEEEEEEESEEEEEEVEQRGPFAASGPVVVKDPKVQGVFFDWSCETFLEYGKVLKYGTGHSLEISKSQSLYKS